MTHTRLRLVAFLVLLLASIGGASSNLVQPASAASKVALQSSIPTGATLSGSVTWLVKTSGSGISRNDFSIDGTTRWTDQTAPYYFNGDPSGTLDTTTLANGSHTLLAAAFDANGVELARVSSTVTVGNTPPPLASTWARYGTANGWRLPFRSTADQDFEIGQDVALGAKYVRIGPSDARRRSSPTPCTPPTAWAPGIASSPSP